ncbi:MAG: T9SS type A sorting domain-containing protein, partial [Anaerolineae bacterium]|nr:T9SS type A sorting domain-containing protein [Anaerolineae bacterium]
PNYPNPFNPTTNISYKIRRASKVTLNVYDTTGKKVRTLLANQLQEAGRHDIQFDASSLPSGIYLYRLSADRSFVVGKMLLVR